MQQTEKTFLVGAAALERFGLARLEHVLENRAEKYRGNQQNGGEQRTAQCLLVVLADADQVDRRDHDHQQDRPVPERGKNTQRFL
ncbi:hypothetical protein D3C84_858070 [compost metagenome]